MKKIMLLNIFIIIFILSSIFLNNKDNNYFKYDKNTFIAVLVNGTEQTEIPLKGNYQVSLACDNAVAKWDYDNWQALITNFKGKIKCTINFASIKPTNLSNYIINLSSDSTNTGVYNENGFRYQGKSPNNWIMFNNELWRIVGVFDDATHGKTGQNLVKIIRSNSIGGLAWHKSNINDWNNSSLKALLNDFYYNGVNEPSLNYCYGYSTTIPSKCDFTRNGITNNYRNLIENVTWKLGGTGTIAQTAEGFYTAERGATVYSGRATSGEGYIGLIYPSDYGYSIPASSCIRTTNLNLYNTAACSGTSWLYGEGYEWTLTPYSTNSINVFYLDYYGYPDNYYSDSGCAVRPVLYLKSDIAKISGDGSVESPYIIVN